MRQRFFRVNVPGHLYSKERLFRQELPTPGRGIHRKIENRIPPGITRSLKSGNTPDAWNSAGNYWLMDMDSDWQDQKSSDR
jgi:hypothetical protein